MAPRSPRLRDATDFPVAPLARASAGLPDGTRVEVSGRATAEEVAAVLLAVDAAARASDRPARATPAWTRAARQESVRNRLVANPADL